MLKQTMDSTDSTLGEIVSSFLHEFLSAYIQEFEQVSDIFRLGIQLKFNRPFSEECYKLLCVIFFGKGKYSRLMKTFKVNWVKQKDNLLEIFHYQRPQRMFKTQ